MNRFALRSHSGPRGLDSYLHNVHNIHMLEMCVLNVTSLLPLKKSTRMLWFFDKLQCIYKMYFFLVTSKLNSKAAEAFLRWSVRTWLVEVFGDAACGGLASELHGLLGAAHAHE